MDGTEDSDHDGLWDWVPSTYSGETCSWAFDSDGDNLGDGLEKGVTISVITSDTNVSRFVPDSNSSTTTNPLNIDSDFDGVPDGWIDGWTMTSGGQLGKYGIPDHEFQFGEGEDRNLNGAVDPGETNPKIMDTDGDHLADGWDILSTASCSTLVCVSETGHYRWWGELNFTSHLLGTRGGTNVYQSAPTDPTNIDSDGDGLVDGNIALNDLPCELVTSHNGVSQTMCTDPSLQDTDGDGLSDGLEISGWEVHIIKETTKQEQPSKFRVVYSNPTIIDTDLDSVNDYFEFENQSDPTKNDTDGDYILDGDELQGQLTQIEGTPPEILKVDGTQIRVEVISTYNDYGICTMKKLRLTVRVRDTAGINYVYFKLEGQPDARVYLNGSKLADASANFSYDEWRGMFDGWDVNVTVFDVNGNGNCTKTHIDGFVEGVVKALIQGFFAFVEAVGKFVSSVFDWIWSAIKSLLETAVRPIMDTLSSMVQKIQNALLNAATLLSNIFRGRPIIDEYVKGILDVIKAINSFYLLVAVMWIVAIVAECLLVYITGGSIKLFEGPLVGLIAGIIFTAWGLCLGAQFFADKTPEGDEHETEKETLYQWSKMFGMTCDGITIMLELWFVYVLYKENGNKFRSPTEKGSWTLASSVVIFFAMALLFGETAAYDLIEDGAILLALDIIIFFLIMGAGLMYLRTKRMGDTGDKTMRMLASKTDKVVLGIIIIDGILFGIQFAAHASRYPKLW